MSSNVESPEHYTQGRLEAIYVIEQVLGAEGFKSFCIGNYLKYKIRHEHKNGEEDLAKAKQYLEWATNGLPDPVDGKIPREKSHKPEMLSFAAYFENRIATLNWGCNVEHVESYPVCDGWKVEVVLRRCERYWKASIKLNSSETYCSMSKELIERFKHDFPEDFN